MCFSATASFTASVVLTGVGIATMIRVRKTPAVLFAASSLLFAVQQAFEGVLWLSLKHNLFPELAKLSLMVFLFFAQVVWPVWVPLSVFYMERNKKRRTLLGLLIAFGGLFAIYASYSLLCYPVSAAIVDHHVLYKLGFPYVIGRFFTTSLYFLATAAPLFISSVHRMRMMGVIIIASFVISLVLYPAFVISVWCYYAAVLSALIYYVLADVPRRKRRVIPHVY